MEPTINGRAKLLFANLLCIIILQSCDQAKSTSTLDNPSAPPITESGKPPVDAGESAYKRACMTCHQAEGQGIPGTYPPLSGTEWVVGDKERLINTVLKGIQGEIEVNGETYNAVMPPMSYLSDKQVAEILTYVRSHFGNEASSVSVAEVAAVRSGKALE